MKVLALFAAVLMMSPVFAQAQTQTTTAPSDFDQMMKQIEDQQANDEKTLETATCPEAYALGSQAPSTGVVQRASQVCEQAEEATCQAKGGGILTARCNLKATVATNKALNNGRTSKACRNAAEIGARSKSLREIKRLTSSCENSTDTYNRCMNGPDADTGDGRLELAVCSLEGAHAGYIAVSRKQ